MQVSTRVFSGGLACTVLTAAWMSGCGPGNIGDAAPTGDDSGSLVAPSLAASPGLSPTTSGDPSGSTAAASPTGDDAGEPSVAACVPTTCAAQGATCGSISDSCNGSLTCGTCAGSQTCGGGGANTCGSGKCKPATCASKSATCGTVSDGCGNVLTCGTCAAPATCGGGGQTNVCGKPAPVTPSSAAGAPPAPAGDAGKLYASLPYRGLAMAGAEFGASYGGQFGSTSLGSIPGDYYYPTSDLSQGGPSWPTASSGTEIETGLMMPYYLGKGMNTIRLPLRWERLQRSLSTTSGGVLTAAQVIATFQSAELAALKSSVSALTAAGFTVLVDIHNYATYTSASEIASSQGGDFLGSKNVPNVAFENLWIGLASIWANDPKVVFDIMNEPNSPTDPSGQPAGYEWYLAAQAAVTGIRSIGANNLILICGNAFADASEFKAGGLSDPLKNIKDPANNFAFEIHDYPDTNFGTADSCTTGSGGTATSAVSVLSTFLAWAKQYNVKGFLGEFSAGISTSAQSSCVTATTQMLTFLGQNPTYFIGWTYWAGGAGFGSDNPMNSEFFNPGHDSPQMTALAPYLK
jgi:endoglucanase